MPPEVFVDAGAWIALSDARDQYHGPARALFERLVRGGMALVTTNLVIAEAYVVIRRRGGHRAATHFLDAIRHSNRIQKVYSDTLLENEAEGILRRYHDQDFSFVDAVSFAVMRDRGLGTAFAFDRHFQTAGFGLVPGMTA